jgi:hypothetical protein
VVPMKKTYTHQQGQYLAFIHYYSKIHGCTPSEAEMQQYFLSLAANRTSDGLDTRSARTHRADAREGSINPSADLAG